MRVTVLYQKVLIATVWLIIGKITSYPTMVTKPRDYIVTIPPQRGLTSSTLH